MIKINRKVEKREVNMGRQRNEYLKIKIGILKFMGKKRQREKRAKERGRQRWSENTRIQKIQGYYLQWFQGILHAIEAACNYIQCLNRVSWSKMLTKYYRTFR